MGHSEVVRFAPRSPARDRVEALAFHPDGHRLYTSGFGIIKEFDLDRHELLDDATRRVEVAAVSPDGRYIASGSRDHIIRIYDAASGQLIRSLAGHSGDVTRTGIQSRFVLLASGSSDKTIKLWNVADGRLARTLSGHTDDGLFAGFLPGWRRDCLRLCSTRPSESGTLRQAGQPATISTTSPICSVAVSPDGRTIAALRRKDKVISLWNAATKQESGSLNPGTPTSSDLMCSGMAFSRDGETLIGTADDRRSIAIWDFPKRRLERVVPVFRSSDWINSLAISPDQSRIAIGGTR